MDPKPSEDESDTDDDDDDNNNNNNIDETKTNTNSDKVDPDEIEPDLSTSNDILFHHNPNNINNNPTIDIDEDDPEDMPEPNPEEEEPLQLEGNKEHNPFVTMFPPRPPQHQERFLGYVPHSGFHNQRMTLETALRLAAHLNRTLLLPPLYLTKKKTNIAWQPYPGILGPWAQRTKIGLESCRDYDPTVLPPKTKKQLAAMSEEERARDQDCTFYHSWTTTPWTFIYDVPKVLTGCVGIGKQQDPIRVFDRTNMTMEWLQQTLNLDLSKDVYQVPDTTRYDFQILDDSEYDYHKNPPPPGDKNTWGGRYNRTLLLSELQARPEQVLHFGSLFASDRLEARSESHLELRKYVLGAMDLWNQDILTATEMAEKRIEEWITLTKRMAPGYLGAHFRTEDGGFVKLAPQNLHKIMTWLRHMTRRDQQKYGDVDPAADPSTIGHPTAIPVKDPISRDENAEPLTFLQRCSEQPPELPLIFMATDIHQPRHSPLLKDYLNEFPCTMFLSDFPESVEILGKISNPADNIHMISYLIALMDANLAAKGREFVGTEKSTFSLYIMIHLWPEYHPGRGVPEGLHE
ncbi:hypothetical protein BGZ83_008665 [Gryganskiella cystojenkinii]|nr:hypothetical protein BGZ83_008665 [Gryganskiella cystojenkinii]